MGTRGAAAKGSGAAAVCPTPTRNRRLGAALRTIMADRATNSPESRLRRYVERRDFGRSPEPGGSPTAAELAAVDASTPEASTPKAGTRKFVQQRASRIGPEHGSRFVVQKHDATRLHWDFRLEHDGVLVSWAVPRGPSLDPADKRLAVHVEDHPLDYAGFEGTIPAGSYGAGTVEIWDRGIWEAVGDAAAGLSGGELKLLLHGERLRGRFVLIRLKPRPNEHAENWLLIKEHDEHERAGADAAVLEATPLSHTTARAASAAKSRQPRAAAGDASDRHASPAHRARPSRVAADVPTAEPESLSRPTAARTRRPAPAMPAEAAPARSDQPASPARRSASRAARPPAPTPATIAAAKPAAARTRMPPGARRGAMPEQQLPQLASTVDTPPDGTDWISEVKFDGYRLIALKRGSAVRLFTRSGQDWTDRLPVVARAVAGLAARDATLDGELVALQPDGLSSFPALQAALAAGQDRRLFYTLFDLTHLDGFDLRRCRLADRKVVLTGLDSWQGLLRYSDHLRGEAGRVRRQACALGLEGVVCKDADAPYRPGRGRAWLKVKCLGREEFVVLGWTCPQGRRTGLGSLQLGFHDEAGTLHYAGGVGTGFTADELDRLASRLAELKSAPPKPLLLTEEPVPADVRWVRPELVAEVQFTAWSGAGRVRHAVYLGLREDKPAAEVVLALPDADAPRHALGNRPQAPTRRRYAVPPVALAAAPAAPPAPEPARPGSRRRPVAAAAVAETDGVRLSHPDRELWPGITKQHLADYWHQVADAALPGIARRPLALLRCPDGIEGEHFFQKHAGRGMGAEFHEAACDGAPYLAIEGRAGLIAAAQLSAIELHSWGATEAGADTPDRVVFDLDPGDGLAWEQVIAAAHDVRARLERAGLDAFCRTSGGKGLHVLAPVSPGLDWEATRAWCRTFAETMAREQPDRYVARTARAMRPGRVLVDWLRNGLGSTAAASFTPRARPGATVATPLAWREVTPGLDPQAFTIATIPARLARLRADPWASFDAAAAPLGLANVPDPAPRTASSTRTRTAHPAAAPRPKPRRR